jgi:hypothetical protein
MQRLGRKFLHVIFTWVLFPLWLGGLYIAAWLHKDRPLRLGKLTICGPSSFRELCRVSVERMASLDPVMHGRLTGDHWVWVFYDDTRSEQYGPPWVVTINSAYRDWQAEGVIARLVYLAYHMAAFPRTVPSREEQAEVVPKRLAVLAQTKAWLEARGFPPALVECYSEQTQ